MPFWTTLHKQIFCTQKQYIDAKHCIYLAGRRPSKMLLVLKESSNRVKGKKGRTGNLHRRSCKNAYQFSSVKAGVG
jgi:hypothetical protein